MAAFFFFFFRNKRRLTNKSKCQSSDCQLEAVLSSQRTFSGDTWVVTVREVGVGCQWHLMHRGQGCCLSLSNAQDKLLIMENFSALNVSSTKVEKLCVNVFFPPPESKSLHIKMPCFNPLFGIIICILKRIIYLPIPTCQVKAVWHIQHLFEQELQIQVMCSFFFKACCSKYTTTKTPYIGFITFVRTDLGFRKSSLEEDFIRTPLEPMNYLRFIVQDSFCIPFCQSTSFNFSQIHTRDLNCRVAWFDQSHCRTERDVAIQFLVLVLRFFDARLYFKTFKNKLLSLNLSSELLQLISCPIIT